jgi:hypothetical protein
MAETATCVSGLELSSIKKKKRRAEEESSLEISPTNVWEGDPRLFVGEEALYVASCVRVSCWQSESKNNWKEAAS